MRLVEFKKVARGERVWIVAPSGPLAGKKDFFRGVETLMEQFGVEVRRSVFSSKGFFAGSDLVRSRELKRALESPACRGMVAMRGGYGATRILSSIDWRLWAADPKPIVGFSDISAIHFALLAKGLAVGVHGPSVASLARQPVRYRKHLFRLLMDPCYGFGTPPASLASLRRGTVSGPFLGGNLTMLEQLTGTDAMPDLDGAVLFLEDVNEKPYRIDRMLVHLRSARVLTRAAGVVLGDFVRCRDRGPVRVREVLADNLCALGVPVASGYPAGHGRRHWAFVQGARVVLRCGRAGGRAEMEPWT
jgi:muramoyltetrapeptide carboxypeptidase